MPDDPHSLRTDRMPAGGACPPAGTAPPARAMAAECTLAWRAVTRDRAWRLATILVLLFLATAGARTGLSGSLILMAAGMLGAVAGSALLAPGPMLFLQRRSAPSWWVAPVGRLIGAAGAVLPVLGLALAVQALGRPALEVAATAAVTLTFLAAWTACAMALGPATGASAAGALGFLAVWAGSIPPSAIQELLSGAPYLQRPAVLLWNTLPLTWRARAVLHGSVHSHLLLLGWTALGLLLAAWVSGYVYRDAVGGRRTT